MPDGQDRGHRDMIYADTAVGIDRRRRAFLRRGTLKCRAVADSLEEAGDRLFTFIRLDPSQWKSARTTNAIERLNGEFRRRIKTQTVLPCAETVPCCSGRCSPPDRSRCARSMAGKPSLSPSNPCPLTSSPENLHMPGAGCQGVSTAFATRPNHIHPDAR